MKSRLLTVIVLGCFIGLIAVWALPEQRSSGYDSKDARVDSLLSLMTLDEKLGQMTQLCFGTITLDGSKNLDLDPELFREAITKNHVGSFLSGTGPKMEWINFVTKIQEIAINESRLGIPLIIGIDHVHGANYVDEGTIFPHNLTMSCSFDTALIAASARVVAMETAPLGLSWNFSPVLDIGKNPFWPRLYETFGEDPHVGGMMGHSFIRAYQNSAEISPYKLSACAKHFIGYSDPRSGWDRTAAEIPDQILYEQFLPPFEKALEAGVKTVMVNSGEVNGEPVHGSEFYLKDILRKRMGFDGVVVTDIKDIKKLVELHAGAETYEDAVLMALNAGIDMSMACNHYEFAPTVKQLIEEGKMDESRIDTSVRRILQLKYDLGLFEHPYPDEEMARKIDSVEHHEVAKQAAAESIVLIKNDGILPLAKGKRILLAGFAANSRKMLNGAWTLEWMGAGEARHNQKVPTLYGAMKTTFGEDHVLLGDHKSMPDIQRKAKQADAIILTVGEIPYSEFKGNTNTLALAPDHRLLIETAIATGKPVILLLVTGRPLIITAIEEDLAGILFTGYPGHGGAEAISELLSGGINPSGKLSFTYPGSEGHIAPYYHKSSEYKNGVSEKYYPLFPFGHGLSYTGYKYSELISGDTELGEKDKSIRFQVTVENAGQIAGKETVLWYVTDEVGKVTRPVKQLVHFEKALISPGEKKVFQFVMSKDDLTYPDKHGNEIQEPGYFTLAVGDLKTRFRLENESNARKARPGRETGPDCSRKCTK